MSLTKPIVSSIVQPLIRSITSIGANGGTVLALTPYFFLDNMGVIQSQDGTSTLDNTSSSDKTMIDDLGVITWTEPNETIIHRARRRQNFVIASEDLQDVSWAKITGATATTATEMNLSANSSSRLQQVSIPEGGLANRTFTFQAVLWVASGSEDMRLRLEHVGIGVHSSPNITLTTTPTSHTYTKLLANSAGTGQIGCLLAQPTGATAALAKTFHATDITCEIAPTYVDYLANLPTDYGYGTDGVNYYDTDKAGDPLTTNPRMRQLGTIVNRAFPSATTDITDYGVSANISNRTIDQWPFLHASAITTTGTQAIWYHTDYTVLTLTDYTLVIWLKMDDDLLPVLATSSSDAGGDFQPVLARDTWDATATSSITKFGDIYCIMAWDTTKGTLTNGARNGLITNVGNSNKNFEVYSIGLIDGHHEIPMYVPTVSASTSWTKDDYIMSAVLNWKQDYGIILMKCTIDNLEDNQGFFTTTSTSRTGQLYSNVLTSTFVTFDGTNQSVVGSSSLEIGDVVVMAAIYNTGEMAIMLSINGAAFVSSTTGTYDGFYVIDGYLELFRDNEGALFDSLRFYHDTELEDLSIQEMKDWVSSSALGVTA